MQRIYGWSERGNSTVYTNGIPSTTLVNASFPNATITVYVAGSNNLATIYSDNNSTPLANPFVATNTGYWDFYASSGRYDVQFSGNNFNSFTLPDISCGAIQSLNGQTTESQSLVTGASGSNFNIVSANGTHTFNIPTASANNNGLLSSSDWTTFNAKSANFSFTAPLTNNNGVVSLTTPLAVGYGGTNATTTTQAFTNLTPQNTAGDLIGFNGTAAVRLPVGANNYVLTANTGNTTGLSWSQVSLTGSVTGTLPIANGGTGATTASGAFNALSPATTTGDLVVYSNNTATRLPVSTNSYVLTANNANVTGVSWSQISLSGSGVTGVLPIVNGGTGANSASAAFNALSPATTAGDLIYYQNNTNTRFPISANNGYLLSASGNNLAWTLPVDQIFHYTVTSGNNAFLSATAQVQPILFNLNQFQKISGVTIRNTAVFTNNNNSITQVTLSIGSSGNANQYLPASGIGFNSGANQFYDSNVFSSSNMTAASTPVLATFTATGGNFGTGANTNLVSGSVDIWIKVTTLQ